MKVMEKKSIVLKLTMRWRAESTRFGFHHNDGVLDEEHYIDALLFARDGEFKEDSPTACCR